MRMIGQTDTLPPLPAGVLGAKIETLFACYADCPGIASFYRGERGVIALFGGRATLCGQFDPGELSAFLSFIGAMEVECDPVSLGGAVLPGFSLTEHTVLSCFGLSTDAMLTGAMLTGDAGEAYDILLSAEPAFAAVDRLEWLSDINRRVSRSRASVFTRSGAAVIVTAATQDTAVIGAVACSPWARGRGAAASLVRDTAGLYNAFGRCVYTVAANAGLACYYTRLGFLPVGTLSLLTRARQM